STPNGSKSGLQIGICFSLLSFISNHTSYRLCPGWHAMISLVMTSATMVVQLQPWQWLICLTTSLLVTTPDIRPSGSHTTTKAVFVSLSSLAASTNGAVSCIVTKRLLATANTASISDTFLSFAQPAGSCLVQQAAQGILHDAAMAVIVGFGRGIDAQHRFEFNVAGAHCDR